MNPHRDAEFAPRPFGDAEMVEVRVSENDRPDIRKPAPEPAERVLQGRPRSRKPRVHNGDAAVLSFDEVPVRI
jgi:hypothetical protein